MIRIALFATTMLLAAPAVSQTVTVETARGAVDMPAAPETVVAFDIAAIDTLYALGIPVAGRPDKLYVDYLAEAEAAEVVGSLFEPDLEAINALQPDLVILGSRSSTQLESLQGLAPTIDMTIPGEALIETGLARIDAYGALFDRADEAAALRNRLESKIDAARTAADGKGSALIVLTNGPKVSAYGADSRFGWVHGALGLEPAAQTDDAGSHGQPISFEFIAEANPDWLIVIDRAAAIGADGARAEQTLDNELVAETTAWEKGQVVYLNGADAYISGGGAQSIERALDLLTTAFSEADPAS
ncbi:siderophore ABC transporter substrate-binding protein [Halovulum sp. GXIMD14794]